MVGGLAETNGLVGEDEVGWRELRWWSGAERWCGWFEVSATRLRHT